MQGSPELEKFHLPLPTRPACFWLESSHLPKEGRNVGQCPKSTLRAGISYFSPVLTQHLEPNPSRGAAGIRHKVKADPGTMPASQPAWETGAAHVVPGAAHARQTVSIL